MCSEVFLDDTRLLDISQCSITQYAKTPEEELIGKEENVIEIDSEVIFEKELRKYEELTIYYANCGIWRKHEANLILKLIEVIRNKETFKNQTELADKLGYSRSAFTKILATAKKRLIRAKRKGLINNTERMFLIS